MRRLLCYLSLFAILSFQPVLAKNATKPEPKKAEAAPVFVAPVYPKCTSVRVTKELVVMTIQKMAPATEKKSKVGRTIGGGLIGKFFLGPVGLIGGAVLGHEDAEDLQTFAGTCSFTAFWDQRPLKFTVTSDAPGREAEYSACMNAVHDHDTIQVEEAMLCNGDDLQPAEYFWISNVGRSRLTIGY